MIGLMSPCGLRQAQPERAFINSQFPLSLSLSKAARNEGPKQ